MLGKVAHRLHLKAAQLHPPPGAGVGDEALVAGGDRLLVEGALHGVAEVGAGQTVLVHGANGGVGSTLVQLARLAGARVIGTASPRHHDAVRDLGATPVDYRSPDLAAEVRALAPNGVDAVFDHVGGPGIVDSYRLLAPRGTLVAYGTASTRDQQGSSRLPVLKLFARLLWWNALPNGRTTRFFNIWAGKRNAARFRARLTRDLGAVFALLALGAVLRLLGLSGIGLRVEPIHRALDAVGALQGLQDVRPAERVRTLVDLVRGERTGHG